MVGCPHPAAAVLLAMSSLTGGLLLILLLGPYLIAVGGPVVLLSVLLSGLLPGYLLLTKK